MWDLKGAILRHRFAEHRSTVRPSSSQPPANIVDRLMVEGGQSFDQAAIARYSNVRPCRSSAQTIRAILAASATTTVLQWTRARRSRKPLTEPCITAAQDRARLRGRPGPACCANICYRVLLCRADEGSCLSSIVLVGQRHARTCGCRQFSMCHWGF
jgi:hypothetical protein